MKINPNDPKWTAYVLGELDLKERASIEELLETSAEARAFVEELPIATTMLKDELAGQSPVALNAGQRAAIHAAADGKVHRWFGLRATTCAADLAAAGLIVFAVITPSLLRSRSAAPSAV